MSGVLAVCFALHLFVAADVPIDYGVMAYMAAERHDVDPYDLAALLVSEHNGAYPHDSVSNRGASGLYQVAPMWLDWANDKYGVEWTRDDMHDPMVNTELAAMVVKYSQDRVEKKQCGSGYHWVAHWKCRKESRHGESQRCDYSVRRYLRIRAQLVGD